MDKINGNGNGLMNAYEVSDYLRIPLGSVYRLTYEGRIKAVKIGKHWRYAKEDIDYYLHYGTPEYSKLPKNGLALGRCQERRKYPRINCSLWCKYNIFVPDSKEVSNKAVIKNISAGGVMVKNLDKEINRNIEVGDPISLDFLLNPANGLAIKALGRIVYVLDDRFGVKFRMLEPRSKRAIARFVG